MSEEDLYRARLGKLDDLGAEAWPVRFGPTESASELQERYSGLEPGSESGDVVSVAGRLVATREQGRLAFGDLQDRTGRIQLFVTRDLVERFKELDTGDIVGATGEVMRTKLGELSVRPSELVMLAKSLRPLPDKWHGLKDVEVRFRQRYLDLISNPDSQRIARLRSAVIRAIRTFFDARGYLEVETPLLHPIPGGGHARPFVTHHNALDADLYLRIAKELYLKRLLVGGLERVYEIGRVFRNEGISTRHNPEFTMLESYQAYIDYFDVMELVQQLVCEAARQALGTTVIPIGDSECDLASPWRRVTVLDAVREATGEDVSLDSPVDVLRRICAGHGLKVQDWWGPGMLFEEMRDSLVEPRLVEPTILYDYPLETSPLARTHRDDPRLAERFEVIAAGRELANAFSELNDPVEQRRRFEAQAEARMHGDDEANPMDEAFLTALEYGMPPAGGLGVGIDRLVMLLAGTPSVREVILFPTLRADPSE